MSTETILWITGITFEAALVTLLVVKRAFRRLPVFCSYIAWGLFSDCAMYVCESRFANAYLHIYLVEMSLDSLFQFAVFVELAWSVLRPFRVTLPRSLLFKIAIALLLCGAAIFPFTHIQGSERVITEWYLVARLQQTFAVLRILIFISLALSSHALSIGWRDRELQVATGLGFYSLVSILATIVHTHQPPGTGFRIVDYFVACSYVCSLIYWLISFAQKEPPRRDFTPRMQDLLSTIAGAARNQRSNIEIKRPPGDNDPDPQD